MKQVDFYLVTNHVKQARLKMASRFCNKLQKMQKRILVVSDDPTSSEELRNVMWSYSDTSFLAHDHISETNTPSSIQLLEASVFNNALVESEYDVLVSLCDEVPQFIHHFERIAEFVAAEEDSKVAGRLRYKKYQSEGFELKMHNIEL